MEEGTNRIISSNYKMPLYKNNTHLYWWSTLYLYSTRHVHSFVQLESSSKKFILQKVVWYWSGSLYAIFSSNLNALILFQWVKNNFGSFWHQQLQACFFSSVILLIFFSLTQVMKLCLWFFFSFMKQLFFFLDFKSDRTRL